jgi:hypothetical protein
MPDLPPQLNVNAYNLMVTVISFPYSNRGWLHGEPQFPFRPTVISVHAWTSQVSLSSNRNSTTVKEASDFPPELTVIDYN